MSDEELDEPDDELPVMVGPDGEEWSFERFDAEANRLIAAIGPVLNGTPLTVVMAVLTQLLSDSARMQSENEAEYIALCERVWTLMRGRAASESVQ